LGTPAIIVPPEELPAGCEQVWLVSTAAFCVKVVSKMPSGNFRFEDFEDQTPLSPALELALDVVTIMGKSGMATVPYTPTDDMVKAGMEVSGATEEQVHTIFRAMLAACDDDGVKLADFAN
jgi:hypothetical protein